MSQSGDGRPDAGGNKKLQDETAIYIRGDSVVPDWEIQPQQQESQSGTESEQSEYRFESDARVRYAIYKAANKGDWKTAKRIYRKNKLSFDATINVQRQTALHVAALAVQPQFAREMMQAMSPNGICQLDADGDSALSFAVVTGKRALVEAMVQQNKGLEMLRNHHYRLPIHDATLLGRKDIVAYLYEVCKDLLENDDRAHLLVPLIDADMYVWNLVTYSKSQKNNLHQSAYELAEYICNQVASDDKAISSMERKHWRPIFVAAEHGNVEFLRMLIKKLPDVAFKNNEDGQTIFHVAVLSRRAEVFNSLSEIGSSKYLIARYRDNQGNNMLHLAGKLSPSDYLDAVPGAALQLQRELLWFERVKKLVGPIQGEAKNNDGHTPDDVFMENHGSMIKEGEEWMKKTADSCTIVAALVATVVFAAAFTAPGGNNQTTGFPMFLDKASFKIFIASDAISLISALSSLLTFMSIQTSTYSLNDFKWYLPMKLLIGYSTLFISIAAMMVAFVTVLFVYFREHQLLRVALPLALVAAIPVGLFVRLHYSLVAGMIKFCLDLKFIHD